MNRRDFLKTIAVGAVVPGTAIKMSIGAFPAPADSVTIAGKVIAYFHSPSLYEQVRGNNRVFIRFCEDTVHGIRPSNTRR